MTLDPRKRIRRSAGSGRSGEPAPDRGGRSPAASPDAAVAVSPRRPDGAVPGTGRPPGTGTSAAAATVPPTVVVPAGGAVGGGAVRGGAVGGGAGGRRSRRAVGALPYGLLVPSVLLLLGLLGYPMYVLVRTSFQQLDLRQLIRRQTVWTGFPDTDHPTAPPTQSGAGIKLLYQIKAKG